MSMLRVTALELVSWLLKLLPFFFRVLAAVALLKDLQEVLLTFTAVALQLLDWVVRVSVVAMAVTEAPLLSTTVRSQRQDKTASKVYILEQARVSAAPGAVMMLLIINIILVTEAPLPSMVVRSMQRVL